MMIYEEDEKVHLWMMKVYWWRLREEEVSSIKNKKGLERGKEMRILNKSDISADEITMREGNNNDNPFEDACCGSI